MRLLVECTYVFEHPNDNSGIQRVVRNIIKHLGELEGEIDCIPVMMQGGRVYQVLTLARPPFAAYQSVASQVRALAQSVLVSSRSCRATLAATSVTYAATHAVCFMQSR